MEVMKKMTFFISLILSFQAFAVSEETLQYLKKNNFFLKRGIFTEELIQDVLLEYHKIPLVIRSEMLKKGAKIHLIQGHGVTEDPTWKGGDVVTWDRRRWSDIPGSGGAPYKKTPTRIVANRLNEGHGSLNLFLHEHAHSLDSTYKLQGVSESKQWKRVLSMSVNVENYLRKICDNDYCLKREEGFAELFARYFHGEESRLEIEQELPLIAEFFEKLISIKKLPEVKVSPKPEAKSHLAPR